jgi:polyisoprenoid-binding protein YceI
MRLAPGAYRAGPELGSLRVKTYREGMAARVGHDLVLEATRWEAVLAIAGDLARSTIELSADPRSLHVREALRGLKPLTDGDRAEIAANIDGKVLGGRPIAFRSTAVRAAGDDALTVEGELTIAGTTRPVALRLDAPAGGRIGATVPLTQSDWGIRPYRGLMGALKVRDGLDVVIDAAPEPAGAVAS